MSNYDFSLKERVVRLSVAAGLIFGIVSSIIWYVSGTYYDDDALFFGIPLGLITFISGLMHFKSHNPLAKFLPFATVFVYFIFFAGDSDFNGGFEISFGIFLSVNICLVAAFLFGLLMNWIDKGN
jgi:peptidoglycan/LPS O-acetylase OafA/YrhL